MDKCSYNPLLGYRYTVIELPLGYANSDPTYFKLKKLEFEGRRNNAQSNNERILYEKKARDVDKKIIDALDLSSTGKYSPRPFSPIHFNFIKKHSPKYRTHYNNFYAELTKEADYSLGRHNATRYLQRNELGIKVLRSLRFNNNPPTELEMRLYGFLRKPEYTEKYSFLLNKMDNLWNELAVRKCNSELAVDIKKRVAEYTRQAKILNEDKSYLLSVEERFKAHYAPCGPGIAELAIAELYRDSGIKPAELVPRKPDTTKCVSNTADYRYQRNMYPA